MVSRWDFRVGRAALLLQPRWRGD